MAIERQVFEDETPNEGGLSVEVEVFPEIDVNGEQVIDFDEGDDEAAAEEIAFDANLAEHVPEADLMKIGADLKNLYDTDKRSRKDWEDAYTKGIALLGLKIEDRSQPWAGASGVFHPMLTESVIRFQSQAIMEIFPASGPVKTKVIGSVTPEVEAQSKRVMRDLNYITTEKMADYRSETETLLFNLPLSGSVFRKLYFDPLMKCPRSVFVPAEDFVVPYGASNLLTAERYAHMMRKPANEIKKLQVKGFYREAALPSPAVRITDTKEAQDKIEGNTSTVEQDDRHSLVEYHLDYDLAGFEDDDEIALPYVITFDYDSLTVLSIRRNWKEEDEDRVKRMWFVHYPYMPGFGFYGLGLIHILGGLTKSATSIMRQLIDAGTLSNLPAGLKSRGLRIKGDSSPIAPGEFRDVDVPGGAIKDNITFLPYKEPSAVLYNLLLNVVEEGRRIGSVADMKIADMNQNAPVGTTLAILERSLKVMSAVQARLHAAMKLEFKILVEIIKDFMPKEYPYEAEGDFNRKDDYDDRVDVVPVSNPNASTMAQRIMQNQAVLQLSEGHPDIYDLPELHRSMIDSMGYEGADRILPPQEDVPPLDPTTENMNIIMGRPVKVFQWQDHKAHIEAHLAAMEDPKMAPLIGRSPNAGGIAAAGTAHIQEHLAFQYRAEIEEQLGTALPPMGEPVPEEVEVALSRLVADASTRVLEKNRGEEQLAEVMERLEDPIIQMRMRELDIKEADLQRKKDADTSRIEQQEATRASEEKVEGLKAGVQIAEVLIDQEQGDKDRASAERLKGVETGVQIGQEVFGPKPKTEQIENS